MVNMRAAERLFGRRRRDVAVRPRQNAALAAELPYLYCGEFQGFGPLHLLVDDALGYAFTLTPPTVDTIPDAEDDVAQGILAMLHALPPGAHWQWFARSEPQTDAALRRYRRQPGVDPCGSLFTDRIIERWQRASQEGFFPDDPTINLVPRQRVLAVAIKSEPLGLARPGLRDFLRRPFSTSADDPPVAPPPTAAQRRALHFVHGIRDVLSPPPRPVGGNRRRSTIRAWSTGSARNCFHNATPSPTIKGHPNPRTGRTRIPV